MSKLKAAHFLLLTELLYSPPNDAIIKALLSLGYEVHVFAPRLQETHTQYGDNVFTHSSSYSYRWIARNCLKRVWSSFDVYSATSEDPFVVAGILSFIYRRALFLLVDEIKSGSYRGDRPEAWKKLCRWTIRRAKFCIVNDVSRIKLLQDYAQLPSTKNIIVYPGCYFKPPQPLPTYRDDLRKQYNIPLDAPVIASSGGFNLTAGAEWLLQSLGEKKTLYAVIQPLGIDPLSRTLLQHFRYSERLYLQLDRLTWHEAWLTATAFDIGVVVYSNPAPQFQNMGISSNRLCMFIAMGVPVICSDQKSFKFVQDYNCGILVSSYTEFLLAIDQILDNHQQMKLNCKRCFDEYIQPQTRYNQLISCIDSRIKK